MSIINNFFIFLKAIVIIGMGVSLIIMPFVYADERLYNIDISESDSYILSLFIITTILMHVFNVGNTLYISFNLAAEVPYSESGINTYTYLYTLAILIICMVLIETTRFIEFKVSINRGMRGTLSKNGKTVEYDGCKYQITNNSIKAKLTHRLWHVKNYSYTKEKWIRIDKITGNTVYFDTSDIHYTIKGVQINKIG